MNTNSARLFEMASFKMTSAPYWRLDTRNGIPGTGTRYGVIHRFPFNSINIVPESMEDSYREDYTWKALFEVIKELQPPTLSLRNLRRVIEGKTSCLRVVVQDDPMDDTYYIILDIDRELKEKLKEALISFSLHINYYLVATDSRFPGARTFCDRVDLVYDNNGGGSPILQSLRRLSEIGKILGEIGHNGSTASIEFTFNISVSWGCETYGDGKLSYVGLTPDYILAGIFANDATKDLTIVVGNGTELKCHGMILAAQSSVFSAMITSNLEESRTSQIEIPDMSEEGMSHLIRYCYGDKIKTDELTCDVALELFMGAHKYHISKLEGSLNKMILGMRCDWFTGDAVLELYYFVMNLVGFEALKERLLKVMAQMKGQFMSCQRFKELKNEESVELLGKILKTEN